MKPIERIAREIDPSAWALLDEVGHEQAEFIGITVDRSLARAKGVIETVAEILTESASLETEYRDDDIHPPRPCWHARMIMGELSTDWTAIADQEQHRPSAEQTEAGVRRLRGYVTASIKDRLK